MPRHAHRTEAQLWIAGHPCGTVIKSDSDALGHSDVNVYDRESEGLVLERDVVFDSD